MTIKKIVYSLYNWKGCYNNTVYQTNRIFNKNDPLHGKKTKSVSFGRTQRVKEEQSNHLMYMRTNVNIPFQHTIFFKHIND